MNYSEEYNTKDVIVTLLQDFLSIVTEEYEASEDIVKVLSLDAIEEFIDKIKTGLELCCQLEIEEKFSHAIDFALSGELTDFSEFDAIISEICGDIDRLSYKSENYIQEGVYQSPFEDLTIGTIWSSNSSVSIGNPFVSVYMRPHKKHTAHNDENAKDIEFISYYLEKATENRTIAWYDGACSVISKDFIIHLYNNNHITDRRIEMSDIKRSAIYYAPFEFEAYKAYIKETKCTDVNPMDAETIVTFFFVTLTTEQDKILSSYGLLFFKDDDTTGSSTFLGKPDGTEESIYNLIVNNKIYFETLGEAKENDLESVLQHKALMFSQMNFYRIYKLALEKSEESGFQKKMLEIINENFKKTSEAYTYWGLKEFVLNLAVFMKKLDTDTNSSGNPKENFESEMTSMYETIGEDRVLDKKISELDFSIRAYNILKRENVNTVYDLTKLYEDDLYQMRNMSRNTSDEIIKKIHSFGLTFRTTCKACNTFLSDEELKSESKLCRNCTEQAEKAKINIDIEDIELPIRTINCLKSAGFYNVRKLSETTFDELKTIRNLSKQFVVDFLYRFDKAGFRIKDCSVEEYPTIDDFIKDNINCYECFSCLDGTKENIRRLLCVDCAARLDRMEKATTITLEIKKPEFQSYTGDENGFTLYININAHVSTPIKLKLQECSIYTGGRQRISNYNYTGYGFSEDYIFPNTTKTFAKIWITDNWRSKELLEGEDYITISLKDVNSNKTFFFKFLYADELSDWDFYDYYELD